MPRDEGQNTFDISIYTIFRPIEKSIFRYIGKSIFRYIETFDTINFFLTEKNWKRKSNRRLKLGLSYSRFAIYQFMLGWIGLEHVLLRSINITWKPTNAIITKGHHTSHKKSEKKWLAENTYSGVLCKNQRTLTQAHTPTQQNLRKNG